MNTINSNKIVNQEYNLNIDCIREILKYLDLNDLKHRSFVSYLLFDFHETYQLVLVLECLHLYSYLSINTAKILVYIPLSFTHRNFFYPIRLIEYKTNHLYTVTYFHFWQVYIFSRLTFKISKVNTCCINSLMKQLIVNIL